MSVKKKILVGLPLLLMLLVGITWLFLDSIVKKAIEVGGESAMGVPTAVQNVSLRPLKGRGAIEGLKISNPSGFQTPFFMSLSRCDVDSELGTMLTDTMVVKSIELAGLEAHLEKNDQGANYRVIMDNMKKGEEEAETKEGGKKVKVELIVVRNIIVHADSGLAGTLDVKIDEIRLEDIGSDTDSGVIVSELMGTIVKATLAAVIRQGVKLPGAIAEDLGEGLAGLGKVGAKVTIKAAGKVIGGAGKVIGGAAEKIGSIFGGGDDDDK